MKEIVKNEFVSEVLCISFSERFNAEARKSAESFIKIDQKELKDFGFNDSTSIIVSYCLEATSEYEDLEFQEYAFEKDLVKNFEFSEFAKIIAISYDGWFLLQDNHTYAVIKHSQS